MKNFEYLQPKSMEEASEAAKAGALPFAGGTDVLGLVKDGIIAPEVLLNLKRLPGLSGMSYSAGKGMRIGALVTLTDVAESRAVKEKYPILAQAAGEVASPQLRNTGTLGGNLCQRPRCDYFRGDFPCARKGGDLCYAMAGYNRLHCVVGGGPCVIVHPSDTAVALLALGASVSIFSKTGGTKTVPIRDFYVLPEDDFTRETVLEPGEIVTEIVIPDPPQGTRSGYVKMKERGVWDFAVVSVGAVVQTDGNVIRSGRVAFGGVAPVPWEEITFNRKLNGLEVDEAAVGAAAQLALGEAVPLEMNAYKVPMARNLLMQLLLGIVG
jgi:xanthine dehydrogenase YagS FAD-binding subunit